MELKPNEQMFPVVPIGIRYICETCHQGEMRVDPNGIVLQSMPAMIPHKCTNCGQLLQLPKAYPYVEFEPVPEDPNIVMNPDTKTSE